MPEYRDSQGNVIAEKSTNQLSTTERIARSTTPLSQPVSCEKCGSSFFYTAHAEQFAGGGYGSMEFRSITPTPIQLRICICGWPKPPEASYAPGARSVQTQREEFFRSVKVAKEYMEKIAADKLLDKVAAGTASKSELDALKQQMETRFTALQTQVAGAFSAASHIKPEEEAVPEPQEASSAKVTRPQPAARGRKAPSNEGSRP